MFRHAVVWCVCASATAAMAPVASATVYDVASIAQFEAALNVVGPGDEIRIAYGVYYLPNVGTSHSYNPKRWFHNAGTVANPIRIIGQLGPAGERPVFDASTIAFVERGIFYFWTYHSNYVIENLEFRNSRGNNITANNAAAAYIQGDNITFRNCYSHHNDDGWFSTTDASNTLLEYCETAYNGAGDGQSHNYYVNSPTMTVRGNYIHNSVMGQNFKMRAAHLVFEDNWLENAGSYEWEIASGNQNNTVMSGCVIVKSPNANNSRIIGLSDGTSSGAWGTLTMINNTIVSTASNQPYLYSNFYGHTNLVLYNNIFAGPSTALFDWAGDGTRTGSYNWMPPGVSVPATITDTMFGNDPGFVNSASGNYHLKALAACRDAGYNSPQWLNAADVWEIRVPESQYYVHTGVVPRPGDGLLDIGAFEFVRGDLDEDGDCDLDDVAGFVGQMSGPTPVYSFDETVGLIVMEAEHTSERAVGSGSADGWAWETQTGDGSVGDGYVRARPDTGLEMADPVIESDSPRLSYAVRFKSSTGYFIWVRGRAASEGSNTVHYGVGNTATSTGPANAIAVPVGSAFQWASIRGNGLRPVISTPPIERRVDFWVSEDGVEIDRIVLSTDINYVPDDPAESSGYLVSDADLDGDSDVDLADFAALMAAYTGP